MPLLIASAPLADNSSRKPVGKFRALAQNQRPKNASRGQLPQPLSLTEIGRSHNKTADFPAPRSERPLDARECSIIPVRTPDGQLFPPEGKKSIRHRRCGFSHPLAGGLAARKKAMNPRFSRIYACPCEQDLSDGKDSWARSLPVRLPSLCSLLANLPFSASPRLRVKSFFPMRRRRVPSCREIRPHSTTTVLDHASCRCDTAEMPSHGRTHPPQENRVP